LAVRGLLVVAALMTFYGCGQSSSPPQESEKEGGVEPKTVTPSGAGEGEAQDETALRAVGNVPISGSIGENVGGDSFDVRVLDYFVSYKCYYPTQPYPDEVQHQYSEAGKFVVVSYSVTNTGAESIQPTPIGTLHTATGNNEEVYEQDDQIMPGGRISPEMQMDEIPPRQMRVSQFVFDVPTDADPELVVVTDEPTIGSPSEVGVIDLTRSYPQVPRPEEILALQYEYNNMTAFEQAYGLFAQETKDRVPVQKYASVQWEGTLAFLDYSFPSIDLRGDRATIDRVATYTNGEETGQDKATQEMVLEAGGWRIVMRDEQYELFLGGGEATSSSASASRSASASP
jgi:hypothetical protein